MLSRPRAGVMMVPFRGGGMVAVAVPGARGSPVVVVTGGEQSRAAEPQREGAIKKSFHRGDTRCRLRVLNSR